MMEDQLEERQQRRGREDNSKRDVNEDRSQLFLQ